MVLWSASAFSREFTRVNHDISLSSRLWPLFFFFDSLEYIHNVAEALLCSIWRSIYIDIYVQRQIHMDSVDRPRIDLY